MARLVVLTCAQPQVNQTMLEANEEAKRILADENLRNEAQVRLNVTRNRLYTSLIKEYFKNAAITTRDKGEEK